MSVRGVYFRASDIPDILNGRKTQFRKIVPVTELLPGAPAGTSKAYAHVGDQLWVHEDWRLTAWDENAGSVSIEYRTDNPEIIEPIVISERDDPDGKVFCRLWMESSDDAERAGIPTDENGQYDWRRGQSPCRWRSLVTMPRWASRILLEVISVRTERLQDISEADANSEGAPWAACGAPQEGSHKAGFAQRWTRINGIGSWEANPWVRVFEFKVVTKDERHE